MGKSNTSSDDEYHAATASEATTLANAQIELYRGNAAEKVSKDAVASYKSKRQRTETKDAVLESEERKLRATYSVKDFLEKAGLFEKYGGWFEENEINSLEDVVSRQDVWMSSDEVDDSLDIVDDDGGIYKGTKVTFEDATKLWKVIAEMSVDPLEQVAPDELGDTKAELLIHYLEIYYKELPDAKAKKLELDASEQVVTTPFTLDNVKALYRELRKENRTRLNYLLALPTSNKRYVYKEDPVKNARKLAAAFVANELMKNPASVLEAGNQNYLICRGHNRARLLAKMRASTEERVRCKRLTVWLSFYRQITVCSGGNTNELGEKTIIARSCQVRRELRWAEQESRFRQQALMVNQHLTVLSLDQVKISYEEAMKTKCIDLMKKFWSQSPYPPEELDKMLPQELPDMTPLEIMKDDAYVTGFALSGQQRIKENYNEAFRGIFSTAVNTNAVYVYSDGSEIPADVGWGTGSSLEFFAVPICVDEHGWNAFRYERHGQSLNCHKLLSVLGGKLNRGVGLGPKFVGVAHPMWPHFVIWFVFSRVAANLVASSNDYFCQREEIIQRKPDSEAYLHRGWVMPSGEDESSGDSEHASDDQLEIDMYSDPVTVKDVLLVRMDSRKNKHIGNVQLDKLVAERFNDWADELSEGKHFIYRRLCQDIVEDGGRFLTCCNEKEDWTQLRVLSEDELENPKKGRRWTYFLNKFTTLKRRKESAESIDTVR